MPNKWTFQIKPISLFVSRWCKGGSVIVDPFSGKSDIGTIRNDLARGGVDAGKFCEELIDRKGRGFADVVIFDPPYSPRQIKECYESVGLKPNMKDTQSGVLYKVVRECLRDMLRPGGVALSFGWQSGGLGNTLKTKEILLIQHGGAHNDTICVAQVKMESQQFIS